MGNALKHAWTAIGIAVAIFACGGSVDTSSRGGSSSGSSGIAGNESSSGTTPDDSSFTMSGDYRCCVAGIGRSCCSGTKRGMCFEYGGRYRGCRQAGEEFEERVACSLCCDGLTRVAAGIVVGDHDPPEEDGVVAGCDVNAPKGVFLCIRCGDGVCGEGENICNCPSDCKE